MARPPLNPTAHLRIIATTTPGPTPGTSLICDHCLQTKQLTLPMTVSNLLKLTKAFETLHGDCKPKA